MKKMNFWLIASLFMGAVTLSSCGDDEETPGNSTDPGTGKIDYSKTGGSAVVNLKDGSEVSKITISNFGSDELSGVELVDDELTFAYYVSGETSEGAYYYSGCSVTIPGYSEGKTTYKNVELGFSQGQGDVYYQGNSVYYRDGKPSPSDLTATVKKQGNGTYHVVVEGDLYLSGTNITNDETPNATIKLDIVAPMIATCKLHKNVSSKQSYMPKGTPWLDGKTVAGALEIKSPFVGSGVLLWYYGTRQADGSYDLQYAQYENLKAQAVKLMGEPFECWDASVAEEGDRQGSGEWSDVAYAYFYKDKKYVMVSYCPWRDTYEGEEPQLPHGISGMHENHAARIHVHILEGMNVDYMQFVHSFGH